MAKVKIQKGEVFNTKYGKIKVIKESGSIVKYWRGQPKKITKALCECHCGRKREARLTGIKNGRIQSCGCSITKKFDFFTPFNYKHGLAHSKIERVYQGLKGRCNNEKRIGYKDYGGRGIKCEWNSFEEFYKDMGKGYREGLSIDRINNDGNYCKENCRWTTPKEQSNNKRTTNYITYNGKTQSMMKRSEELNISYTMIRARIRRGWDGERALLTPKRY